MKINNKILIVLGVIFIAIVAVWFFTKIPSSFTINFERDQTSSGASRNYKANLTFIKGVLVGGSQTYYVGQGGGCTTDCERTTICKIVNQNWVDSVNGGECSIGSPVPLTIQGINQNIKSKEIKSMKDCRHLDLCYEIMPS